MSKHLKFFLLALFFSIPFWLIGAFTNIQLMPGIPVSALWIISSVASALILYYKDNGILGTKELLKKSFDFGRIKSKIWYLPIIFLYPAIMATEFFIQRSFGEMIPNLEISIIPVLITFLIFFVAALAEELGWMGYAFEPMLEKWGALKASIVLGLVWAGFHIIPIAQTGKIWQYVAWQCVGIVAGRVLFVWIYMNTGKSVFAMAVLHAMLNLSWQLFPGNTSFYNPQLNAVITIILAIIVVYLWGSKTLAAYKNAR